MTFTAFVRRHSPVWRMWSEQHRMSGSLAGIFFQWVPGGHYVADVLDDKQIEAARLHTDIELEATAEPVPEPEPILEPEPVSEPEPESVPVFVRSKRPER